MKTTEHFIAPNVGESAEFKLSIEIIGVSRITLQSGKNLHKALLICSFILHLCHYYYLC